ncbi:MAG: Co2+/Mg2+ efflux protein ApaG [Polyangiaceae bacterium]
MKPSEATTQGIRVVVKPQYLANESRPVDNTYVFAYEVTIANVGDRRAKLLSRHWIITNGHGEEEHVRGPGVVGEHPDLGPGEAFRYRSYCPLSTPEGAMRGSYRMVRPDGSEFDAEVAEFAFSAPRVLN